jgi:putative membrane protein
MLSRMLRALLISWVVMAAAFALTTWILSGMTITGGFFAYLWISLLFGVVNAIVGTFLRIITLPVIVLTLGLFSIVINAVLLEITDALSSHLTIDSFFWTAIWGALILSIVAMLLQLLLSLFVKTDQAR